MPDVIHAPAPDEVAPWTEAELRQHYYSALVLMRQVGDVQSVDRFLAHPLVVARGVENADAADGIAEAHAWLEGAREHERIYGIGSMIDRSHATWVDVLEPSRRRVEQILRAQGKWPHGNATYTPGGFGGLAASSAADIASPTVE